MNEVKQMQYLPSKCLCGKKLRLYLAHLEENVHIISGVCKKCEKEWLLSAFEGLSPIAGVDYIIINAQVREA